MSGAEGEMCSVLSFGGGRRGGGELAYEQVGALQRCVAARATGCSPGAVLRLPCGALSHCQQHVRECVADLWAGSFLLRTAFLRGASCTLQAGAFNTCLSQRLLPWGSGCELGAMCERFEVWWRPLSFPFRLVPAI